MENIILRQSSSLGGRTSPVTELMPSDSLEYNTIDEKMCQSHGYNSLDGHDVICFDHTEPRSNPNKVSQTDFALQMNLIPFRGDALYYNNPEQFSTCLLQ